MRTRSPFIFPAAARVGYPAELVLQAYTALLASVYPSYYYYEYGGGLETAGSIEGVNSLLMQSNEFAIALFPVWPANRSAAFTELRAKGAFLLTAFYNAQPGRGVSPVLVHSEAGLPCSLLDPWQYSQQQKQDKLWRRYQRAMSGPVSSRVAAARDCCCFCYCTSQRCAGAAAVRWRCVSRASGLVVWRARRLL